MKDNIQRAEEDREDLRWIRKARQGNQKAFERLVVKYQKRIYYTVRKMVLDHSDTNDIVQDAFVKVYMNLDRFDEKYPFYPWLHRIVVNTAINHQTKAFRRKERVSIEQEEEYGQMKSEDGNPLKTVLDNELKSRVARAVEQLPLEQRAVFVLRTSEGLSYQEISEQLNVSVGTVMSRLSRAREKLKHLLQPYLMQKNMD